MRATTTSSGVPSGRSLSRHCFASTDAGSTRLSSTMASHSTGAPQPFASQRGGTSTVPRPVARSQRLGNIRAPGCVEIGLRSCWAANGWLRSKTVCALTGCVINRAGGAVTSAVRSSPGCAAAPSYLRQRARRLPSVLRIRRPSKKAPSMSCDRSRACADRDPQDHGPNPRHPPPWVGA